MPHASNLQKLADRPADHPRRGVMDFIEANQVAIRAALSRQHSWTVIFEEAVKDGCPTKSVRYFTRAAKSVLGLETSDDDASRSGKARRAAEDMNLQCLPGSRQGQTRQIAQPAYPATPDATERSPARVQRQTGVERVSAPEVGEAESSNAQGFARNNSFADPSNPSGTSGDEVGAEAVLAVGNVSPSLPTRQLSQPHKSELETALDSAAPGQRAMLLNDAE